MEALHWWSLTNPPVHCKYSWRSCWQFSSSQGNRPCGNADRLYTRRMLRSWPTHRPHQSVGRRWSRSRNFQAPSIAMLSSSRYKVTWMLLVVYRACDILRRSLDHEEEASVSWRCLCTVDFSCYLDASAVYTRISSTYYTRIRTLANLPHGKLTACIPNCHFGKAPRMKQRYLLEGPLVKGNNYECILFDDGWLWF